MFYNKNELEKGVWFVGFTASDDVQSSLACAEKPFAPVMSGRFIKWVVYRSKAATLV